MAQAKFEEKYTELEVMLNDDPEARSKHKYF